MRIRILPHHYNWDRFKRGEAITFFQLGYATIWLCPIWFPGWQLVEGSLMVFIIPGVALGWQTR